MRLLKNFSKEEQHQGNFGATLILIMVCFALWGFTNDITGVMVSAFSRIFVLDMTQGSMVNVASFMGYLVLAIPAAIFTQRYTYKKGVMLSLLVYATGILLLLPAKGLGVFHGFLLSYFIMTCGSAALETCCHPLVYILKSRCRVPIQYIFDIVLQLYQKLFSSAKGLIDGSYHCILKFNFADGIGIASFLWTLFNSAGTSPFVVGCTPGLPCHSSEKISAFATVDNAR